MSDTCGACGATLEPSETIHVVGEEPRCYPCFNREIAERIGIDYEEAQFQPIVLEDADGAPHTFVIRSIFVPTGHELEAVEKTDGNRSGYRFAVLGDFEADPWALFQRLFASMREAVTTRHVRRTEFGWQLTSDQRLAGRIEWDPERMGTAAQARIVGRLGAGAPAAAARAHSAAGVAMYYDVIEARYVGRFVIWLRFRDNTSGEIDLERELYGPVFEPLRDPTVFRQFEIHPEFHTLTWPNGADFAPEFLHDTVRVTA